MKCPWCQHFDTRVVDSRVKATTRVRRRSCDKCGKRFVTTEVVGLRHNGAEHMPLYPVMISKKSGKLEPFSRDKLRNSILSAISKPGANQQHVDDMVSVIDQELSNTSNEDGVIESVVLGNIVLQQLRQYDLFAFARYASIHHRSELANMDELVDFLKKSNSE